MKTMLVRALFCFAMPAAACFAQNIYGSFTGVITDTTGSVVPNVTVIAKNQGTAAVFTGRSDTEGTFWIRNLPVGVYDLTGELTGFQKFDVTNVRVQVDEVVRVDMKLTVGSTTEAVTVTGVAQVIDTTTATLKAVVDEQRIEGLPLNGRNAAQLMRLITGVTNDPNASVTSGTTYPGTNPVSINGNRSNTTNYLLDGAQNNDLYSNAPNPLPNPDALQEFSVQTNNFSAEFGRQSGGIVNAVTKSGTNELHGTAFEYVRNNDLNAANFFAPVVNGSKLSDGLKRNQFGGTIGGPVWIPKLYHGRDRTFFFFSYQGTLTRIAPVTNSVVVPTAAQKAGDFSSLLPKQIKDPVTGVPYPGNIIPADQLNPISTYIVNNALPLPVTGNKVFVAIPNNTNDNQVTVRGDHAITDRNRISGRYYKSWADTPAYLDPHDVLAQNSGGSWYNESVSITDTHTFTPNLLNQLLYGFTHSDGLFVPIQPAKSLPQLGANYSNAAIYKWQISVSGYFNIDTGDTNHFPRGENQAVDTLRWTHGKQQMTFGADFSKGHNEAINNFRANGQWAFGGTSAFTTDSLADFMIGRFNTLTQGVGEYKNTNETHLGVFFQDSIKLTRRLTIDAGLRWEPFFPFTDDNNKIAVWRPGQQSQRYVNAPLGVLYVGDPNVPKSGVSPTYHNVAPRLGFAWDVAGDGKTSVRGGYGIFYDYPNALSTNSQADQAPFGTVLTTFGSLSNSFLNPYVGVVDPFPGQLNPPKNAFFPTYSTQFVYAGDFRNPYVQSWNLTIERQLWAGFVARSSYAGSKGTRLAAPRELNPAIYVPGASTATTNQRRPFAPAMGSTPILESVGNSTFHSWQNTLERRYANGLTILTNLQWAKAIDDTSLNKQNGVARTNPANQRFDKGLADFDREFVFNFSGLYKLPIHPSQALTRALIGGWEVNAIATYNTGQPFTVLSGVDNALTGASNQRADLIGNPYFSGDRSHQQIITQYLNPAAFAANAIGTYGNLGRNTFIGPGFADVDFGLVKDFSPKERFRAQLRFEAFNALNHANFKNPSNARNSVTFLQITSAYDPRILQLALRLGF